MKQPILYLCGPMTGLPDNNRLAFLKAEDQLRAAGFALIVNPVRNGTRADAPWITHMRVDIANMITTCDAVATLPGCESSRGAVVEIGLATGLGWPVRSVDQWLSLARTTAEAEALLDPSGPATA